MTERFKSIPPRKGHVDIPMSSRRAAQAGLALYTACQPHALWAQRATWHVIALLGPRALPGRAYTWDPLTGGEHWDRLTEIWRREIGAFDSYALHRRRPLVRSGFGALLLRRGEPLAFVKLRKDYPAPLEHERVALEALARRPPHSFEAPRPLAWGESDGWSFLALSAMPRRVHTVVKDPPFRDILADMAETIGTELGRPASVPFHWVPLHGDFTPWNLRSFGNGRIVLLDWEEFGWAPPAADIVWYDAVSYIKGLPLPPSGIPHTEEAMRFWLAYLESRTVPGERSLRAAVLRWLRGERRN